MGHIFDQKGLDLYMHYFGSCFSYKGDLALLRLKKHMHHWNGLGARVALHAYPG